MGVKRSENKAQSDEVMHALEEALYAVIEPIRVDGVGMTRAQWNEILAVFRKDKGYLKIAAAVKKGSDADLQKAKRILGDEFRRGFRNPLLKAIKALPHAKGGRPKLLSEVEKAEACDRASGLIRTAGLETRAALRQTADHYGVSLRTIQRIWKERANHTAEQNT